MYKIFAMIAYKRTAFVPYLIFAEDAVQQAMYIMYNIFRGHGMLVFAFAIFFTAAGMYDTLLWLLDAPGYMPQHSKVSVDTVAHQLLPDPNYVVLHTAATGNVTALDARLEQILGGGLFKTGFNFSLTADVRRGRAQVATPTRNVTDAGPRIWLDDDGFSVSADTWLAGITLDESSPKPRDCAPRATSNSSIAWRCTFSSTDALAVLNHGGLLQAEVHFDDASDRRMQSRYLHPPREDNAWSSVSKGGGTVLMKQLFTVTKGRRRHAFLHTAVKASLLADVPGRAVGFSPADVADLLTRMWDPALVGEQAAEIADTAQRMAAARANNVSFSQGWAAAQRHSVEQFNVELLNAKTEDMEDAYFTLVRVSRVHITHVRSDLLAAAIEPAERCSRYYVDQAVGGRSIGTDCYKAFGGDDTGAHFLGQYDNTAMFILNEFFGNRGATTSANALSAAAMGWLRTNEQRLDNLLLSRGYIMAIDPGLVTISVSNMRPAMSYLQLLLVLVAAVAALLSYGSVTIYAAGHYSSSLLANLVATTARENQPKSSQTPRYLRHVPDIRLERASDRIVMKTHAGVYQLGQSESERDVALDESSTKMSVNVVTV
jgi:hypothetical protein